MLLPCYFSHQIHWNPVNKVTNGPKKFGSINMRVFFTRKCMAVFARQPKKSGHSNEVTVLPKWPWGGVSLYYLKQRKGEVILKWDVDQCFILLEAYQCILAIQNIGNLNIIKWETEFYYNRKWKNMLITVIEIEVIIFSSISEFSNLSLR